MQEIIEKELVEIKIENPLATFTAEKGLDYLLVKVKEKVSDFKPDVSTVKGRSEIASIAYKITRTKTAIDKIGKELTDELKDKPRIVDSERKRARDFLDNLAEEVRKPLTEWENNEKQRIQKNKDFISTLAGHSICVSKDVNTEYFDKQYWKSLLQSTKEIQATEQNYQEFADEVTHVKDQLIIDIEKCLLKQEIWEKEQAELEILRKEKAENDRKAREEEIRKQAIAEAEEKAKREAEAVANKVKEEQEKIKREAAEAIAKAEKEKQEEINRIKREEQAKEQKRLEEEKRLLEIKAKEEAEEQKRIASKKHIEKIQEQSWQSFQTILRASLGLFEDEETPIWANDFFHEIIDGKIKHLKITYEDL